MFSNDIETHYVCMLFLYEVNDYNDINFQSINFEKVGHDELEWIDIDADFTNYNLHEYAIQNLNRLKKTRIN